MRMSVTPIPRTSPHQESETLSPERLRFVFMVILMLVTVGLAIYYLVAALQWYRQPFPGMMVDNTLKVANTTPSRSVEWPGLQAGIQAGDVILSINGQVVNSSQQYNNILGSLAEGQEVSVVFSRSHGRDSTVLAEGSSCNAADGPVICETSFTLSRLPGLDLLALFITPFISGVVLVFIASILIRLRPWHNATLPIVALAAMLANITFGIFDLGSTYRLIPVWLVSAMFAGATAVFIGITFPTQIPALVRNRNLRFMPFIVGAALSVAALTIYRGETPETGSSSVQLAGAALIVSVAIMTALMFSFQRPFAANRNDRQNANIILAGLILALAPGLLWAINQMLIVVLQAPPIPLPIELTMPFLTVPIFSLFFANTQTRQIDSDQMVTQRLTYLVMMLALVLGYFLLVYGASLFTAGTVDTDNPLLIAITVFLISVLFIPVRTALQNQINRVYFRTRVDYQDKLETFAQQITNMTEIEVMISTFRDLLDSTVKPNNTLVFLKNPQTGDYAAFGSETDITFASNSGVVDLLKNRDTTIYLQPGSPWPQELIIDRIRLEILRVMIIAGLPGRDELNGFICLSSPKSGSNNYDYEALRFINNVVGQLAIGLERAQAITALERRVNELNVLSQVGQAVNFTVEVDDLLELLSVQTLRLIDSPYFYITLLEPATNQLYFAFFLENDIRDQSKENKKWPMGSDLFSEVISSSQPIRVDNYAEWMRKRNYRFGFENPNTRAWMGVPLVSGTNTFGVLAIGESNPDRQFTADQMRIFSDISALAATSIEKANLFNNANLRARQLSVLNDISRQLVETEGDLDKLLDLITQSAVDILGSEAGSLLLTLDDGRLQFTASVGGTSDKLLGTTLPAGHGLVGQVAKTGQPIISNDTSADERWQGEVLDAGFSTDSILAVPLITKGIVVGVLEVINKRDGTIYVEDDVKLLSAFASQAAIAYENARLRQQTGVQLEARVQELEALERIDRELNRTLELSSVAEITIRWAINNSRATAGILGIVLEDLSAIRIVARSGYNGKDAPEGADEDLWPLNKGIVSRVMRTRRPEVQPDVSIDPDYIPSLSKALSQITVPMLSGQAINAILVLETDREPRLGLLDLDWVQRLAEHASIAIANAQLYEELARANETKSEFVAFAAHELKNPLTSVMGWAATMRGEMANNMAIDQIQNIATVIHTNADRMQNIINDLRDIAASDANKLQIDLANIDLHKLVADTLLPYQTLLDEKNQTVLNEISEDLPQISADPKRMIQVLTNFISNAHKYSQEGGTIKLQAEAVQQYTNRKGQKVGPMMKISITDDGIGMSEEDLGRIFREDYFRSDNELARQQKGTGLGMMITQRIIEGHRGEVWVESELGKGSTFHFVVPLASEQLDAQSEQPERQTASD
jgi:signal transduction histidine kinase